MRNVPERDQVTMPGELRITKPSLVTGLARTLDLGGEFDPPEVQGPNADARALAADWRAVGNDIVVVLNTVGE